MKEPVFFSFILGPSSALGDASLGAGRSWSPSAIKLSTSTADFLKLGSCTQHASMACCSAGIWASLADPGRCF